MKHLMTYNESVRDKMTPIGKDKLDKLLKKFDSFYRNLLWGKEGMMIIIEDNFSEEEINRKINEFVDSADIMLLLGKKNKFDSSYTHDILGTLNKDQLKELFNRLVGRTDESVRDKMTPKSKDDIDKVIDNFFKNNPDIKIFNWKKFGFDFVSYQVKPSLYSFVFLAPDDLYWYLFIWKDGTLELRTSHFQEKGVRFKTNDDVEWYLGTKYETVNESIRDKMTPKPEESIKVSLRDYFKRRKVRNPVKSILDLEFLDVNNLYFINDENKYYDQTDDYTSELVWSLKGEVIKFSDKQYTIYPEAGIVRYWNLGALEGIYFDGKHLDDLIEYISDDKLSESVKDKMTPKEGALDKLNQSFDDLSKWLVDDKNFDTVEDAMGFLEWVSESIEQMLGLGMELDEVYGEITQFNMDEYLYSKGLPLKFAFQPKIKDDPTILGSDVYNREHHMFYYETPETRKMRDERIIKIRNRLHLDESIRDKMAPISDDKKEELKNKILDMEQVNRVIHMLRYPELFNRDELRKEIFSIENSELKDIFMIHKFSYLFTEEEKDEAAKDFIKEYFDYAYKNNRRLLDRVLLGDRWKFFDDYKIGTDDNDNDLYLFKDVVFRIKTEMGGADYLIRIDIKPKDTGRLEEGVRDKMTPKSDEEIDRALDNMSYPQVAAKLLYAAQDGDTIWAKKILDKGMSPNCQTQLGTTPLMHAVMRGHYDLVELLLKKGAKIDIRNKDGKTVMDIINNTPKDFIGFNITPQQKIAFRLYGDKVERLLRLYRDKQMNESVKDMMTPKSDDDIKNKIKKMNRYKKLRLGIENDLLWVVKEATEEGSRDIIYHSLELEPSEDAYESPLVYAIEMGRTEIAEYLLDAGYNFNMDDNKAMKTAVRMKNMDIVNKILEKDHNLINVALLSAVARSNYDYVKTFISKGADVHYKNEAALTNALGRKSDDIIRLLLDKGANLYKAEKECTHIGKEYAKKFYKDGLFHKLMRFKRFKTNEGLKDKMTPKSEADINTSLKGVGLNDRLVKCALEGYLQGVKSAFEQGADIHHNDDKALGFASREGHTEIVRYLLDKGADVHGWYDYAIVWAASLNHNDIVRLLVEHDADVNAQNGNPLRVSIIHKNKELEKYLVDNGAEPERVLNWAAGNGDIDTMKYLFKTYPNMDVHYHNETILENALLMNQHGAVDFLIKQGADPSKCPSWELYKEFTNE